MKIQYKLIRREEVHFDHGALAHAVQELLPHLLERPIEYNEAHNSKYVVNSAAICIAWRIADETRLEAAQAEHFRRHPADNQPFRPHLHDGYTPAGMAFLFYCDRPWKREGKVEDVIVHPNCRGQGIGRELMKSLMKEAKESGLKSLSLTSRPSRVEANALYSKLGFVYVETNVFRLKL